MFGLKFWRKRKETGDAPTVPALSGDSRKTLGRFELIRELGRGSMGVVYLGRDPASGRNAAIKTMTLASHFKSQTLGNARERFLREAKILAWLHHPNIVSILDAGEDRGLAYIAMEFLDGRALSSHADRNNLLPLPRMLDIAARAADALEYAHEQNVVHCDIKPGNIIYDPESDTVKVLDFGISRLACLSVTRPGLVVGSPLYMSPEQVLGKPVDRHSDLFSLGVTLYQLASGRLPFEGESDIEVMHNIVQHPPADIRSFAPDLPPCLCAIIDRALAKDPAARYRSGAEMADALRLCAATL